MLHRRKLLTTAGLGTAALLLPPLGRAQPAPNFDAAVDAARRLSRLNSLLVAVDGRTLVNERLHGPALDRPVNIKSLSKTLIAALTGIAIDRGLIASSDQPITELLGRLPADATPGLERITVGNLLSMQAGLERTSGSFYGRWIASRDWTAYTLTRPFVDRPGGAMLYSTGNTHLLSRILTRVSDASTLTLARTWLGDPLGIQIPAWTRDPQGIYLGGNEMSLSPMALLRFGELFRQGGTIDGRRVISEDWIATSWQPRTRSFFNGSAYGYGWFIDRFGDHPVYFGWGYGGQLLYVLPSLGMSVAMLSDPTPPSPGGTYLTALHALVAQRLVPAAEAAQAA